MDDRELETPFGPIVLRLYRLSEGWWPVVLGQHSIPCWPLLRDPLPQSADEAVQRMSRAIAALVACPARGPRAPAAGGRVAACGGLATSEWSTACAPPAVPEAVPRVR